MSETRKSLRLDLSQERTQRLLEWAGALTQAEVDADCLPSGYELVISIGGPFGCDAEARKSGVHLALGEISCELIADD